MRSPQSVYGQTLLASCLSDPRLRIVTRLVTTRVVGVEEVAISFNRKLVVPDPGGWLKLKGFQALQSQRCIDGDTRAIGARLFFHDAVIRLMFCDATIRAELGEGYIQTLKAYNSVMSELIAEFKEHFPSIGKPTVLRLDRQQFERRRARRRR